jgi:hypothetical protein
LHTFLPRVPPRLAPAWSDLLANFLTKLDRLSTSCCAPPNLLHPTVGDCLAPTSAPAEPLAPSTLPPLRRIPSICAPWLHSAADWPADSQLPAPTRLLPPMSPPAATSRQISCPSTAAHPRSSATSPNLVLGYGSGGRGQRRSWERWCGTRG